MINHALRAMAEKRLADAEDTYDALTASLEGMDTAHLYPVLIELNTRLAIALNLERIANALEERT